MNLLRRIHVKPIVFCGKLCAPGFQCLSQMCQNSFLKSAVETSPGVFAVGRGGSKSEELQVAPSTSVGTFCQRSSTGCALCLVTTNKFFRYNSSLGYEVLVESNFNC